MTTPNRLSRSAFPAAVALFGLTLPSIACAQAEARRTDGGRAFEAQVLFDAGHKLSGCVVADFDPKSPGDEICVVGDRDIYLVWKDGEAWKHKKIAFPLQKKRS